MAASFETFEYVHPTYRPVGMTREQVFAHARNNGDVNEILHSAGLSIPFDDEYSALEPRVERLLPGGVVRPIGAAFHIDRFGGPNSAFYATDRSTVFAAAVVGIAREALEDERQSTNFFVPPSYLAAIKAHKIVLRRTRDPIASRDWPEILLDNPRKFHKKLKIEELSFSTRPGEIAFGPSDFLLHRSPVAQKGDPSERVFQVLTGSEIIIHPIEN